MFVNVVQLDKIKTPIVNHSLEIDKTKNIYKYPIISINVPVFVHCITIKFKKSIICQSRF